MVRGLKKKPLKLRYIIQSAEADIVCVDAVSTAVLSNYQYMSQSILEFDRTSYSYPCGSRVAIQGLNLKVPAGKRCGLIGQNGCGKTTFFLLANGLYQPQQGIISWQGEPFRYERESLAGKVNPFATIANISRNCANKSDSSFKIPNIN